MPKKSEKEGSVTGSVRKIVLQVDAIETPRGLVPSVKAIESIVAMLNDILKFIYDEIKTVSSHITKVTSNLVAITETLRKLVIQVETLQNQVVELKVDLDSIKQTQRKAFEKSNKNQTKKIREELMELLK